MKKTLFWIVLVVSFFPAYSYANDKQQAISVIVEDSAILEVYEHYQTMMKLGVEMAVDQAAKTYDKEINKEELLVALDKAFDLESAKLELISDLNQGLNEEQARLVSEWYQSALGKKITELEKDVEGRSQNFQSGQDASAIRLVLLEQLDEAVQGSKFGAGLTLSLQEVAIDFALSVAKEDAKAMVEQQRALMSQNEEQVRLMLQEAIFNSYVSLYAPLTDDQLREYVAFNESHHGREYNRVIADSFGALVLGATQRYLESVKELVDTDKLS